MAINEISKGVFYVSTPETKDYKMSAAGGYVTTFTKAKADLWDLSLKQAAAEIKSKEEAYQTQLEAYLERQKQLDKIEADFNAAVLEKNQEAKNKAYLDWMRINAEQDAKNKDRALKASEIKYPTASVSYGLGSAYGAGVKKAADKLSPEQSAFIKALVNEAGGNTAQAFALIDQNIAQNGVLKTSTPDVADAVRAVTSNELVNYQATELGIPISDAIDAFEAEANIVDPSNKYVDAFARLLETPEPPAGGGGAGGGAVSRRSGPVARPAYGAAAEQVDVTVKRPEDLYAQLDLLTAGSLPKIDIGAPPTAPQSDYITTARDIFAGRAGPTMGSSAAYKQRLVLDTLLRMSPEDRKSIIQKYGGGEGAPAAAPAPTAAAPAAPAAQPAVEVPPGRPTYRDEDTGAEGYLAPGNVKVETKPGTSAPQQAAPPAEPTVTPAPEAPMIPQTEQPVVTVSQPEPTVPARRPSPEEEFIRQALGAPPEPKQDVQKTVVQQPPFVASPILRPELLQGMTAPTVQVTAPPQQKVTREAVAPAPVGPTQKQKEEAVAPQLPPIPSIEKPIGGTTMEGTSGPPPKPAPVPAGTASTPKGRQMQYVEKIFEGAKELVAKKDKLNRVTSSGEGKLVSEIYFGNKNKNKDFKTTWEEVTMSFADSPTARERAHTIAMALDLRSKNLNKTPEVA